MNNVDGSIRRTCQSKLSRQFNKYLVPEKPQDHISIVTDPLASRMMSTNDKQPDVLLSQMFCPSIKMHFQGKELYSLAK